jgi:hypothetical protein
MKVFTILFFCLMGINMGKAQDIKNPFLKNAEAGKLEITPQGATHFANLALDCIQREYPNKLSQVLQDKESLKEPSELHPAFYGCYDWHSSVHGHWMLVRLLKQFPDLPEGEEIRAKLNENLSSDNIQGEVRSLAKASKSWERTYGWAWLLKLSEELLAWDDEDGRKWSANLQPLSSSIVLRYLEFLPLQTYPVRTGVHPNTAFGLSFAYDYALKSKHDALKKMIEQRARDYYMNDSDCPAEWEPSGEDFLSACLEEANLMRRVLPKDEFSRWFAKFMPRQKLEALQTPAIVSDRSDPKLVHLDGVNLSRAWCMYGIIPRLKSVGSRAMLTKAAASHLMVTIPNIASEHYVGTHWLASFAVFALSEKWDIE